MQTDPQSTRFDVAFVGGGLASALAALAVLARRPNAALVLVERGARLGGNHTWCFHQRDVPGGASSWIEPLVVQRWPGYMVRFPGRCRRVASAYACVSSARLHDVVSQRCARHANVALLFGARAVSLDAHQILLEDGRSLRADLVIDARGPRATQAGGGYQKFVGLELAVAPSHPLREPILIDASVPQRDGLRFMYALPLAEDRVLIEDTYFSDGAQLDDAALEREIEAYAGTLGLRVRGRLRKERGVLPMPSRGVRPRALRSPLVAGYGGGYFHPVTGYSFPLAVRFAEALARTEPDAIAASPLAQLARAHRAQLGFLSLLTRALFGWFEPDRRWCALEHVYRLPEPLIERFYAAELTASDRLRIVGRPPRGLSWRRALGLRKRIAA